jgi:hypothetical protein
MVGPVRLELTADEALVLFGFLARFSDTDRLAFEDQAEERALWNLHCLLEKHLLVPDGLSYPEALTAARGRLRDDE